MTFSILTLFPDMFTGPFTLSIIKRAQEKNLIDLNIINIRDFAIDNYKTVDDHPFGGGVGMILKVDVIDRALIYIQAKVKAKKAVTRIILLDPKGTLYSQQIAQSYAQFEHLILVAGHYEGVDARVNKLVDEITSIGNYVLTGGELAAAIIVDSVVRLLPDVLSTGATHEESFTQGTLEAPQYTRPSVYKDMRVPKVLLSGNHKKIQAWKQKHTKQVA